MGGHVIIYPVESWNNKIKHISDGSYFKIKERGICPAPRVDSGDMHYPATSIL
jgi:hypothetical protein